jgi:Ser/Thr protein kinase RdoA (MazF antagonist)
VKTFPDNPNLDHLRQQAKDLLAGLRDADAGATLAQAQALLAEQYGFASWTDLKGEVDRGQGSAAIADPALARELADRYGLGEVTGDLRSLAPPDEMGRRWSLVTDRGRWAVRTMDTWIRIVDHETDVALQEAAARAGVLLPTPVRSRAGEIVETVGGHPWRVYEWLPAGPPLSAPAGSEVTRAVGEILATLHGLDLPVDRISPWHTMRFASSSWPELAATASARKAGWAPALADAVPALLELEALGADAPAPPPVLSHNGLVPSNVRRRRDGRLVVSGWEHAGGQPPAWELCEDLAQWTVLPGGGVNVAGARAMVEGYRARGGHLPPLDLTDFRGSAVSLLNYVNGQITSALDPTDDAETRGSTRELDERRRFFDRSVTHLLAHLPTRQTYERLLDVAVSACRASRPARPAR